MGPSVERVTEAVRAQHRPRVDDDTVADADALEHHHPGVQVHVLAEHRAAPDEGERPDTTARADDRLLLHDRERADRCRRVDARPAGHAGRRVHAGRDGRLGMEESEQRDQGLLRAVHLEQRTG